MTSETKATLPAAVPAEWDAVHSRAGLADLSAMGRLEITGADALDLLNRLTTNKLETLPEGTGRDTVVTNGNGRVVDFLALASLPGRLLCVTSPGRAQAVIDWLDTYTFGEDISVRDVTASAVQLALTGPDCEQALERAGAVEVPRERGRVATTVLGGGQTVLWRALPGGADGFLLVMEAARVGSVRNALLAAGAVAVSRQTWEVYRVANGMPVYGAEFDESANPLEARLRGAISEEKGCYTGQEVIARLLTYRKVQRRLMAADLDAPLAAGTELISEGAAAGRLTSAALLPDGRYIGLALVPIKLAAAGRVLEAPGGVRALLREPAYALATEPTEE